LQLLEPTAVLSKSVPVILNCKAGGGHSRAQVEELSKAFHGTGIHPEILPCESGESLRELLRETLKDHPPVVVAAGGDGTVSAVAEAVRGTGTALGVLPLGTLNHFAKDLGLPLEAAEAARVIAQGRRTRVDLGEVNGRSFINNASLGIYPKIVRERADRQRRFGHSKRTAMLWATLAVLDRPALLELRLELDEQAQNCRAPFVFIGNNDYALEGFEIGTRARLDAGKLNVYTTKRASALGLLGLALRAIFGRLRQADDFMESAVRSLRVESRRPRLLVAIDGEVRTMETPLEFSILPRALEVIVP
jgi:diacylglycerol kinase family enzyme